MTKSGTMRL